MNPRQRPFYFMIPFWGEAYRDYFVDMCLPSLLAPHNFPILNADEGHRFLIATTKADWAAIENLPIIQTMRKHVTPVLLDIEPPGATPPGSSQAVWQQNHCQRLLVEAAYNARALACMLWPDIILSDGMVSALQRWAAAGHELVLFASLRHSREAVVSQLKTRNILSPVEKHSLTSRPITLAPRALADISVRNLHPEVSIFDVSDPRLPMVAPFIFSQVPGDRGIIIHTFAGQPILMDFAAIDEHDTECLNHDIFEHVYVDRNFSTNKIHFVSDSDEFGILSLTPAAVGQLPDSPLARRTRLKTWLALLCCVRAAMKLQTSKNRRIRRDMFRVPIRWHTLDIDEVWKKQEIEFDALIERTVGDFYEMNNQGATRFRINLNPWRFPGNVYYHMIVKPVMPRLTVTIHALMGDVNAFRHIRAGFRRRLRDDPKSEGPQRVI
jgi:hypothetical protein